MGTLSICAGIEYEEAGASHGGVPVVLLHGIGGNTRYFAHQLAGLASERRVLALNLPGYGRSPLLSPLTFEALSGAVLGFLDHMGIEKAHLCGQSIGGMIALETACVAPRRVASLALIATTPAFGGRDESFREAFLAARIKPLNDGMSMADLARAFVPEITGPDAGEEVFAIARACMGAVPEATYRAIVACLTTFNRRADLEGLEVPACLIAGQHDTNAPPATMARMASKIRSAHFHEIPGAGHLVNLEAPEATNDILRGFYQTCSETRSNTP